MSDNFALFGEPRRPWLDPEKLKEKYYALARKQPAGAELNEAFRFLSDPRLRVRHLLELEGAELKAGRDVPATVVDLFWNSGTLLRAIDHWLVQNAQAKSTLSQALLHGEKTKLETRLKELEQELSSTCEREVEQLRQMTISSPLSPNELKELVQRHDALSYLTRLREQAEDKIFRLEHA